MNEKTLKYIDSVLTKDKLLQKVRKRIKKAVKSCPNKVTFEDAKKQVENTFK
jgi:hypothetical protein